MTTHTKPAAYSQSLICPALLCAMMVTAMVPRVPDFPDSGGSASEPKCLLPVATEAAGTAVLTAVEVNKALAGYGGEIR